jgi:KDO2-lipid IV(A) lauroyltransferase
VTAIRETDVPATSLADEATTPRLFRRPSDRFRREDPRQIRHRLATAAADVVSRLASWLPDAVRNGLADRAGDVWVRTTPVYRENVMANLAQVMGPATPRAQLESMARQVFRMSARNFGELLRLKHLPRADLAKLMPMPDEAAEVFSSAHARGQGIVVASAHMGAFDLVGHAIAARGVPLIVITGRTTKRFIFDAVTHLRHSHGVTMVEPSPAGVRQVIRALRRAEIAGFLADYDFFGNGLPVRFFGRETTLPPGPIRLARDTGALVLPVFPRRTPTGHEIGVGEPFTVPKTADVDADVAAGMEILKTRLEAGIGATPGQWVLFQRAWPSAPAPPDPVAPAAPPGGEPVATDEAV